MPNSPGASPEQIAAQFARACQTSLLSKIRISYQSANGQAYTRSTAEGTHPVTGEPTRVAVNYQPMPGNKVAVWVSIDGARQPLDSSWEQFSEMTGDISDYAKEQFFDMLRDLVVINTEATKVLLMQTSAALNKAHEDLQRIKGIREHPSAQGWIAVPDHQAVEIVNRERERVLLLLNNLAASFNDRGVAEAAREASPEG